MHAISVKELRGKFPLVRSELKKGESFLLIHKSKPIAELIPVSGLSSLDEATDEEIENAMLEDLGDDYLSDEEVQYYLSLKSLE